MPSLGAAITEPGSTKNNKTGGWRSFYPEWDESKCTQCMMCWLYCPDSSIPQKKGKRTATDLDYCKGCGICANVCPVKCISMKVEKK